MTMPRVIESNNRLRAYPIAALRGARDSIELYRRRSLGATMFGLVIAFGVALFPEHAWAHTPHIDVARIGIDSEYLFTIVRENLWLSVQNGPWRRLWRGLPYARVRDIALASGFASQGRAALATDAGLHYTTDYGDSWNPASIPAELWPSPENLSIPFGSSPHARLFAAESGASMVCLMDGSALQSRDCGNRWTGIENPPPGRATAALGDNGNWWLGFADGAVWRMRGIGAWEGPWRVGSAVTALLASCSEVYAGTDGDGVWKLSPGGAVSCSGLPGLRVTSLAPLGKSLDLADGGLAATTWREGVFIHSFSKKSWTLRERGLTREAQADHAPFFAPHFRQVTVTTAQDGREELLVGGFDGLFRSSDLGRRWLRVATGVTTEILAGVAADQGAGVVVSLYGGGARSVRPRGQSVEMSGNALKGVRTFAVAKVPLPDASAETWVVGHDYVYALAPDESVVRQAQLGAGAAGKQSALLGLRRRFIRPIKQIIGGLPPALRDRIRAAVVNGGGMPGFKISVSGIGSQIAIPNDFETTGVAFVSTWRNGLFRTDDHGRTFSNVWAPDGDAPLLDVAVAPRWAARPLVLIATERGLLISDDGGQTFGETGVSSSVLRLALASGPDGSLVVFAATWAALLRCHGDPSVPGDWHPVLDCRDAHAVTEIALAPNFAESGIALVNVAGQGLFCSNDGGASFTPCPPDSEGVTPDSGQLISFPDSARTIAFSSDFAKDGVVWAAAGTILRRSADGGLTWRRIALTDEASGGQSLSPAPTFLILGAQKAATTWLARILSRQPGVFIPPVKELHYFTRNYNKGPEWYQRCFEPGIAAGARAIGEATPNYLAATWPEYAEAAERIARHGGDLRFIVVLRNPVDRAISAYLHHVARGRFNPFQDPEDHLENVLHGRGPGYGILEAGLYGAQLLKYFEYFGRERFHILVYEEIRSIKATDVVKNVLDFIGLAEIDPVGPFDEKVNVSVRSRTGARVASIASVWMRTDEIRMRFGGLTSALGRLVDRIARGPRLELAPDARAKLAGYYRQDVAVLHRLLDRKEAIWPDLMEEEYVDPQLSCCPLG